MCVRRPVEYGVGLSRYLFLSPTSLEQPVNSCRMDHANADGLAGTHLLGHRQMNSYQRFTQDFPVRTPIQSHTDLACNTSYHFVASRMVSPWVPPYLAQDRLHLLAHVYDGVVSIHMTENPGRHD